MYYNVHCTFIGMYISDFLKILSKMFCSVLQNILNSAWQASAKSLNPLPPHPPSTRNL